MLPEALHKAINEVVPSGITHIGFVPTNIAGEILVAEPEGHLYGVSATFSKVKIANNEKPFEALARCLTEQVGVATASAYPIPSTWVTPNSTSYYFAGLIQDRHDAVFSATASLQWLSIEQARVKISQSSNSSTRQRDLSLLSNVSQMCLSPYRNILLMLRELHLMGFERLRAYTYIYALGTWHCEIIPATWISNDNQSPVADILFDLRYRFEQMMNSQVMHFYTSANEQAVLQLPETVFMTPHQLAIKFLKERPQLAAIGYGPDAEYAAWYEKALELLAPNGIFHMAADLQEPTDYLYTSMARADRVSLPPPGQMNGAEWNSLFSRIKDIGTS